VLLAVFKRVREMYEGPHSAGCSGALKTFLVQKPSSEPILKVVNSSTAKTQALTSIVVKSEAQSKGSQRLLFAFLACRVTVNSYKWLILLLGTKPLEMRTLMHHPNSNIL